jgi:hypothetical protein
MWSASSRIVAITRGDVVELIRSPSVAVGDAEFDWEKEFLCQPVPFAREIVFRA